MPFVWCLGSILGPTLGGALARPVLNYPSLFAHGTIWDRFPYLLPNLVCTVIVSIGVVIGILFLEETHAEKKYRRDPGLEAGKWLVARLSRCAEKKPSHSEKSRLVEDGEESEVASLLSQDEEDQPPGYCTTESSPKIPTTQSNQSPETLDLNDVRVVRKARKPVTKAFTKQVVRNIVGYGILA